MELRNIVSKDQKNKIFLVGRGIYFAALDKSQYRRKAERFMENLTHNLTSLDSNVVNHLISGMFFEMYFDGEGELRKGFWSQYLKELFTLCDNPRFADSVEFIKVKLRPYSSEILMIPAKKPDKIEVVIMCVQRSKDRALVTKVWGAGKSLLHEGKRMDRFTSGELERKIIEFFALHPKRVKFTYHPSRNFKIFYF